MIYNHACSVLVLVCEVSYKLTEVTYEETRSYL
eukprot:COSAG06_NODE_64026_length_260_cov_1.546584_1_plen_32_part_01